MTGAELDRHLSNAKRFGWPRQEWEDAVEAGGCPRQLALLASRLREIKPRQGKDVRFDLRPKERRWLATRLIEEGYADDATAREQIGVSRTTWWRIARELEEARSAPPVSNQAPPDLAAFPPIRSFHASSGAASDDWTDL